MCSVVLGTGSILAADTDVLDGYRVVALPQIDLSSQTPLALADDFLSFVGVDIAETEMSLSVEKTPKGYLFDFHLRGYLDDSLAGENYRMLVKKHASRYFVSHAGVQYICARGANTTEPQVAYCP
ncbi:hypothetical protein [Roseobacter sp. EG26]|uniref:hypothetical protein n=1 Tax=Roseobacter sp. EG26 TaxID=3412477 RepID=UPI003CE5219E